MSLTGEVFAIAATVVNPPAAAARKPVAIVSFCGKPGIAQMHMRIDEAGHTQHPRTSMIGDTLGRVNLSGISTAAITPSRTNTSCMPVERRWRDR